MEQMEEMEEMEQTEDVIQKEKAKKVRDRVGELTDLSLCPECTAHLDCFANMEGWCTGLRRVGDAEACSFYKNAEENLAEARRCYQRLRDEGRSDLIAKYVKTLSTMGMLDDEIEAAEKYGEEFDSFRESNYQEQLTRVLEDDGFDDDLLDEDSADADDADEDGTDDSEDDSEEDEDAWDTGWRDPRDDGRP